MRPGIVLHFRGRTTSPFHSTRQEFANLIKCSPYILGSTIRGALLKRLIERGLCPHLDLVRVPHTDAELAEIHRDCALHSFFPAANDLPSAWFSFGHFRRGDGTELSAEELASRYRSHTRIALERASSSVSEGAIATLESIAPDTPFAFDIVLFGDARAHADALIDAAHATGEGEGWGRFRSIGFGQFVIERAERESFEEWIERARWMVEAGTSEVTFEFVTPYVLSRGDNQLPSFDSTLAALRVRDEIAAVVQTVGGSEFTGVLDRADLTIRPEFISLFSYERGMRQNSLVSLEGSWVVVRFTGDTDEIARALTWASVLGIGVWNERGFGRFHQANGSRRHKRYGAYLPRESQTSNRA